MKYLMNNIRNNSLPEHLLVKMSETQDVSQSSLMADNNQDLELQR